MAQANAIRVTAAAERERVVSALREQAPKLRGLGITRLSLFGSMARGDTDPKSESISWWNSTRRVISRCSTWWTFRTTFKRSLEGRRTSHSLPSCATRSPDRRQDGGGLFG